jgi:hypothetical protein
LEARLGAIEPVVVYLPSRSDSDPDDPHFSRRIAPLLAERGVHLNDLTPCLAGRLDRESMFLTRRRHYSKAGNAAVAACIDSLVRPLLH